MPLPSPAARVFPPGLNACRAGTGAVGAGRGGVQGGDESDAEGAGGALADVEHGAGVGELGRGRPVTGLGEVGLAADCGVPPQESLI